MSKPWDIDLSVYDDEETLLEGLRRRDRFACSCMLKRYAPRLYRLALQLTGDPDEAEDVLQEAFIRGCEKIDDFEGLSSLGTWLHRIVVTTGLMHLRRQKSTAARVASTGDDTSLDLERVPDDNAGPSHELLASELRDQVDAAVMALPDTLRVAFVLREIEGLSTKEASEVLGIGESALKVRLHRARLALRDTLATYLDPADHADTS
jgi:RNA polymerase sigma-70 factor, ECF subfamily